MAGMNAMDTDTPPQDWKPSDEDRRSESRAPAAIEARLDHPAGRLYGTVVDISFGGAKFVTPKVSPVVAPGSRIVLTLTPIRDARPGALSWNGAIVRRELSADDGPERVAYALAFEESAPRSNPVMDGLDVTTGAWLDTTG